MFLGIAMWRSAFVGNEDDRCPRTKDTINCLFDDMQVASKPIPEEFRQLVYILLNLAEGGGWPGAQDATTAFLADYSIVGSGSMREDARGSWFGE